MNYEHPAGILDVEILMVFIWRRKNVEISTSTRRRIDVEISRPGPVVLEIPCMADLCSYSFSLPDHYAS